MQEITMQDTESVGGAGAILNDFLGRLATMIGDQVMAGNVDYAGMAEEQGHYYNMVGA